MVMCGQERKSGGHSMAAPLSDGIRGGVAGQEQLDSLMREMFALHARG
jgi:hypothetical protein